MNKRVALSDLSPLIQESLEENNEVIFTITGISMMPMLHHRRDKVCLVKPQGYLKKYDIAFYVRDNGKYILHRMVKVKSDQYVMIGDNQWRKEYAVSHSQVIGVVKGFWRNDNYISCDNLGYRIYCRVWVLLYPLRWLYMRSVSLFAKVYKVLRRTR